MDLADGPANLLPIPPHRGAELSSSDQQENRSVLHRAWRMHFEQVQPSLRNGFYQGWDLHPAQLPCRYAAVYAFFLQSLPEAALRLRNFVSQSERAARLRSIFDDAAKGLSLVNFFRRGLSCGALTKDEADLGLVDRTSPIE